MIEYKTIQDSAFAEYEINKSRFLAYVSHIESEEQAQTFIQSIKKKHYDARHNCCAYIIGELGQIQKSSDDGEPSGTAGAPILEVLKKNELSDIVLVVTRYFGGIKLGAGGLIRAYGKSATLALDAAVIVRKSIFDCCELTLDYDLLGTLENYLHQHQIRIDSKEYAANVKLTILLPQSESAAILKDITDMTAARCQITKLKPRYINIPISK